MHFSGSGILKDDVGFPLPYLYLKLNSWVNFNPTSTKINGKIIKHLLMLYSNDSLKHLLRANMFSTMYKRSNTLKEILPQYKNPN